MVRRRSPFLMRCLLFALHEWVLPATVTSSRFKSDLGLPISNLVLELSNGRIYCDVRGVEFC